MVWTTVSQEWEPEMLKPIGAGEHEGARQKSVTMAELKYKGGVGANLEWPAIIMV